MSDDRSSRLEDKIDDLTRTLNSLVTQVNGLSIRGEGLSKLENRLDSLEKAAVEKAEVAKLQGKVEELEKWKMMIVGAAAVVGALSGGVTHILAGILSGK